MKLVKTSFQLVQTIIRDSVVVLSSSEKWVLVVIADTCNPKHNWQGYPSLSHIADKTSLSTRTVSSALKSLKDKGILSALPGYTGRCSHYIIHIEKIADARYVTQAELDKRKEKQKPVDRSAAAVQQSSHQQVFSHPDYDDDELEQPPF